MNRIVACIDPRLHSWASSIKALLGLQQIRDESGVKPIHSFMLALNWCLTLTDEELEYAGLCSETDEELMSTTNPESLSPKERKNFRENNDEQTCGNFIFLLFLLPLRL